MHLEVITPDQTLYNGEIKGVRLPGKQGSFEVLNNHAPLISSLHQGQLRVTDQNDQQEFLTVNSGFVEVLNNKIIVLV